MVECVCEVGLTREREKQKKDEFEDLELGWRKERRNEGVKEKK